MKCKNEKTPCRRRRSSLCIPGSCVRSCTRTFTGMKQRFVCSTRSTTIFRGKKTPAARYNALVRWRWPCGRVIYAAAPGMYLQEWIEEASLTQQEAADRLGLSRKTVNGIIKGTQPVSQETAIKLERVTSIPRDAWLRFEAKYRAGLARLEDEKKTSRVLCRSSRQSSHLLCALTE